MSERIQGYWYAGWRTATTTDDLPFETGFPTWWGAVESLIQDMSWMGSEMTGGEGEAVFAAALELQRSKFMGSAPEPIQLHICDWIYYVEKAPVITTATRFDRIMGEV